MRKVVQVRGTHGSGKTTMVRQFLQLEGAAGLVTFPTSQGEANAIVTDTGFIVMGKYPKGSNFGGCDGYKNRTMLVEAIDAALGGNPAGIVFEGVFYGMTVKLARDVAAIAERHGYAYRGVYCHREFEDTVRAVHERNGGRPFNEEKQLVKCQKVLSSYTALKRLGYDMVRVDVANVPKSEMGVLLSGYAR